MSEQSRDVFDSAGWRYGMAIAACLLFLLLKLGFRRYLGDTVPFVLFFSAVMISAWFGGLGPGILATVVCTAFVGIYFLKQDLSFWGRVWPLVTFTAEGVSISVLSYSRQRVLLDRTTLLNRERAAREEAEQIGRRLIEALGNINAEMTQRKKSEESLRASETQVERQTRIFDTTLSSITDFAYILDRDARFVYVNKALLDLWGLKLEQAIGKDFFELKYPDELAGKLARQVREVFETKKVLTDETPYTNPSGATGFYEYIFSPVLAADGTVEVIAGSTRDVTERKRSEAQLRQIVAEREGLLSSERSARGEAERASRMKDEFLATLSHELRTPLNAILGWSQILASEKRSEADLADGLAAIERNARSQTQIIEDLLDMSRIISGKVRFHVQRVDLAPLVRLAVDTLKPAADAKGIRFQTVLDPEAGPVSGDPNRLQQIFWNLLSNSIKFTPRGGRVQVLLQRINSHIELNIIDTGEGIKPEFLPHVFDRFRQSDASTTRRHGGLGLGLAIVKQLVELHGGSVCAKSSGEGQGATFTVSLPMPVIHPEPEPSIERRHPGANDVPVSSVECPDIAGVKVLVLDDEPDARALVKRFLEDCSAVVILAASADEALEKVRTERPDVIASDIGMPTEDGYSFIRRVRALQPEQGGNTPALALTAYARAEDRIKAVMAGFQHHVSKPVAPAELIAMIASLAGRTQDGPGYTDEDGDD